MRRVTKRRGVVPWWGRWLPWLCAFVAVGCWSWSLGIGGWKLFVFAVGLGVWLTGYRVSEANRRYDR